MLLSGNVIKNSQNRPKLLLSGIFILLLAIANNINWGKNHWKNILEGDAKGYYAYLPAVFIYHDLNFGFFDTIDKQKYFDKNIYYEYRTGTNGKIINKYYCGTAILQLPFFLTAHGLTHLTHGDTDGYSRLYPVFINIAALFYMCLGLYFLSLLLRLYQLSVKTICYTIIACAFGTNLFYYTISEPGMSHVYSFACITLFFYLAKRYFMTFRYTYAFWLSLLLGLIVLIRPVNGIVLFCLPLAAGSLQNFKTGVLLLLKDIRKLIFLIVSFFIFPFVQLIIYKISTGSFLVYAYGNEHLYLFSPNVFNILFSYKKGLFLYTPLYLISLTGIYFLWKRNRFEALGLALFLYSVTYILSCWWMWFYGGSFSSRVFVEYLAFFMLALSLAFQHIATRRNRIFFSGAVLLLILLCQIQTYQYRYNQIHWSDMTKEKYWDVFLRIDKLK